MIALNEMINDTQITTDTSLLGCDVESYITHDFDESYEKLIRCTGNGVVLFAFKQFDLPDASDTLTMKSANDSVLFG